MKTIKYLSLFSGIGGFEVGIEKATSSWDCVGFSEIKPHSIQVYKKHYPGHQDLGDITKLELGTLPDFDVLVGGFPCQPYSIASNKRDGLNDQRGQLFFNILSIIEAKKPKCIFLENVKGMVSHNSGETKWLIEQKIRELGYKVFSQVLNSKNFGVHHQRERLYFVCFRDDLSINSFNFPKGRFHSGSFREILEEQPPDFVFLKPKQIMKMKGFGTENAFGGYLSTSETYNCITASYGIDCGNSMKFWRDGRISALSPLECERLQSFPDHWTECIPNRLRYQTLGNAVTTNVITEIVKSIHKGIG